MSDVKQRWTASPF